MSHSKRYEGTYIGEVVSVADPQKLMRVQVRVYDVFDGVPPNDLPWATYNLPLGSRPGEGGIIPVKVGDLVNIDFPHNGDTRRPRITGAAPLAPGGKPNLPGEAFGQGEYQHKRTPEEPQPETPGYHEDITYKQNGVLIQLTKSGELRFTQIASGTSIEISKDGHIVLHGEKDVFVSAQGKCLMDITGDFTVKCNSFNLNSKTQGKVTGPGGLSFEGPANFNQTVHAGGNITSDASIIDTGGNTNHHSH